MSYVVRTEFRIDCQIGICMDLLGSPEVCSWIVHVLRRLSCPLGTPNARLKAGGVLLDWLWKILKDQMNSNDRSWDICLKCCLEFRKIHLTVWIYFKVKPKNLHKDKLEALESLSLFFLTSIIHVLNDKMHVFSILQFLPSNAIDINLASPWCQSFDCLDIWMMTTERTNLNATCHDFRHHIITPAFSSRPLIRRIFSQLNELKLDDTPAGCLPWQLP